MIGNAVKVMLIATGEETEEADSAKSAAAELGSRGGKRDSFSGGRMAKRTRPKSSITTESASEFAPVTPGEVLRAEFLAEFGLSQNRLAKAIGISPNRIAEIVNNRRRISADTALRLALYFGNSAEFWLNLQAHYDLKMARRNLSAEAADRIKSQRAA